jgi:hypothetical protein
MLDVVVEGVFWFVREVILQAVFYWPGWIVLRALTFGRYPPSRGGEHNRAFVAVLGLAFCICLICIPLSWVASHA